MIRRILVWFFRNRHTGSLTIVQAPNLVLWIVIVAALLGYLVPYPGNLSSALRFVVKGGLVVWATDEIFRGVNPWRRCLGMAVLIFELATILPMQ